MLTFNRCPKPKPQTLAKNVPSRGLHGYERELDTEIAGWEQFLRERRSTEDTPPHVILYADETLADLENNRHTMALSRAGMIRVRHPKLYEANRRHTLGSLALAILMRNLLEEDTGLDWKKAGTPPNIRPEGMHKGPQDEDLTFDSRVHMTATVAETDLQLPKESTAEPSDTLWYRAGDLLVRRSVQPKPTENYIAQIAVEEGAPPDLSSMQTFFPYLASRP